MAVKVAALLLLTASLAQPCVCVNDPKSEGKDAMDSASLVFRGTVIARSALPPHPQMRGRSRYAITFRVDEYWKGSPSSTVTIYKPNAGIDCDSGDYHEVGKNYLVYADQVEARDAKADDYFMYGWSDVLPSETKILIGVDACAPSGETTEKRVRKALRQLGKGHIPKAP